MMKVFVRNCLIKGVGRGFTLIELLVVIAIIAILAAILMPVLNSAKIRALVAQDLSNKRQIAIACTMYPDDFNNYIVPNAPLGPNWAALGWCNGNMGEAWSAQQGNIDPNAYTSNCLASYMTSQVKVYKCPGDNIPSANGDRIRSISMNSCMIGNIPTNGISYTGMSGWHMFKKVTEFIALKPVDAWIFCDEGMYSLNDGYLQMDMNSYDFPDVPGNYHGKSNCFSFEDGHVEAHTWKGALRNVPYAYGVTGTYWPATPKDPDYAWLKQRSSSQP